MTAFDWCLLGATIVLVALVGYLLYEITHPEPEPAEDSSFEAWDEEWEFEGMIGPFQPYDWEQDENSA